MNRVIPNAIAPLRFPEFRKIWKAGKVKDFSPLQRGFDLPVKDIIDGNYPVVFSNGILKTHNEFKVRNPGVVTGRSGTIGKVTYVDKDYWPHNTSLWVTDFKGNNPKFIYYFLIRLDLKKFGTGSGVPTLNRNDVHDYKTSIPTEKEEQQKIANFLSSVDKKTQQLTEKQSLLQQYKKGIMQKLFSQEIRFKDEQGNDFPDWEEKALGTLADKINNKNKEVAIKNVLTNSAKQGIINQTDYFDKDIANQNNLGGYYIVEKDDFVFNPRISEAAPVGPIKRNKLFTGVMSPLYTVFRFQDNSYLTFLELYFETTFWHRYMKSIANYGARHDRMNITMGDFMKLPLPCPSKPEMRKIVDFIEAIDSKLAMVTAQVEQTKAFKKGLLQQMFV